MDTLDHPYRFDGLGRTATTGLADHVRDLIEQVLLTSPGERVMRPDFGAGLLALVFEPAGAAMAATAQLLAASGLQRHLSHLIAVESVECDAIDATLLVRVSYRLLADGSLQRAEIAVPGAGGGIGGPP